MKKINIIFSLILTILVSNAQGQSFTTPYDTVRATVTTSSALHNDITNVSSDTISIIWSVVDHDFPVSWGTDLGICDNNLCYTNTNNLLLNGGSKTTNPIPPSQTGIFYLLPSLVTADPGTHYLKVRMRQASSSKEVTWIVNKWPTGVTTINKSEDDLIIYPNPAKDDITILSNDPGIASVVLTDVFGKTILTRGISSTVTTFNISNYASGIYMLRFIDEKGNPVTVRKFLRNHM